MSIEDDVLEIIEDMSILEDKWQYIVTTAPTNYDLPGTLPLCDHYGSVYQANGNPEQVVRLVQAYGKDKAIRQISHYLNSLYIGTLRKNFSEECKEYSDYYKIDPKKDQWYHRKYFDFEEAISWDSLRAVEMLVGSIERTKTYMDVDLSTDDGGLTYCLTIKGHQGRFDLIKSQLQAAFNRAKGQAQKVEMGCDLLPG